MIRSEQIIFTKQKFFEISSFFFFVENNFLFKYKIQDKV